MISVVGVDLPLIAVRGTWYHAASLGYPGRILNISPRGERLSPARFVRTRFNPGDFHGADAGFETLYLALDGKTALFEKQVQLGDPFGPPEALLVTPKIGRTSVVPVDVNLDGVLDLSDVTIHALLETNAQEITGDWRGYQIRGPGMAPHLGVLTTPTGLAPTQRLAWELHQDPRVKGIVSVSAKVPTTRCLVIFTHRKQPPDSLSWADPNSGKREHYP